MVALFTDDDRLAGLMRQIRVHGQMKKHHHPRLGINGRLDSIQATIVMAKMAIFDEEILKRQSVAEAYNSRLDHDGITLPGCPRIPRFTPSIPYYVMIVTRFKVLECG